MHDKNKLVKNFIEHQGCTSYENALGKRQRGQGIYILYNGDTVYYIGLSKSSLRRRLRQHHTRDKHRGQWDTYSFYQIRRSKYIKDIETILLRTFRPPGNVRSGRFKKGYNLAKSNATK